MSPDLLCTTHDRCYAESCPFHLVSAALWGAVVALTLAGAHTAHGQAPGALAYEHIYANSYQKSAGLASITGQRVDCAQGRAQRFSCRNVDLLAFLTIADIGGTPSDRVNDIWGWTDPQTGREYALVGRIDGTSFVDVTDAAHPVYVGTLPMTEGSRGNIWRDIKVYQNHAFVVADNVGDHGMQVFDLTKLRQFDPSDGAPMTFDQDAHYDRVASSHNVVINEATGFAYIVGAGGGGQTCGGGLHMVDIQEPKNPTFAGCFADPSTGRAGTGYTHDAQCVVYAGPDTEHQGQEICIGANETALSIADVTDKAAPKALSTASYPDAAYVHQGWLTEDHRYFFQNDELDERAGTQSRPRTLVWDLRDLDDPQVIHTFTGSTTVIDHNLYAKGDSIYQANYESGLRILDISDPTAPEEVGFFDTYASGDAVAFNGAWSVYPFFNSGTIAVSSIGEGLFLLRPDKDPPLIEASALATETEGRTVRLTWTTLTERAAGRFEIEQRYAPEASTWQAVRTVDAQGTQAQSATYDVALHELGLGTHTFRVRFVTADGRTIPLSERAVEIDVPGTHQIASPYPNPAAGRSQLSLVMKERQAVRVAVYNALGQRVQQVHRGPLAADVSHRFAVDTGRLASGTYFWRVEGEDFAETRSFTVVK